jgi:anti-anti-sigma factor
MARPRPEHCCAPANTARLGRAVRRGRCGVVDVVTEFVGGPTGLQVSLRFGDDRATVAVSGDIDRLSGPMLANLLNAATDGSVPVVEVDVAQVGFIDIAGVRVLSRAQHLGVRRGVALTLGSPPSHFVWLLQITGTTTLLPGHLTAPGNDTDTTPADAADPSRPDGPGDIVDLDPGDITGTRLRQADERDRKADERDRLAEDMRCLDVERGRLLDERLQRVLEQQRWEDIREDVANERERDLERREHDC